MGQLIGRRWWIVGLAFVACGCGQDATSDDDVTTRRSALTVPFTLPLFVGNNPTDVAVSASRTLAINDRAKVFESVTGTNFHGWVSNLGVGIPSGQVGTNIGVSAEVGTIQSAPLVMLRSNAKVFGAVYHGPNAPPVQQTGVTVSGVTKVNVGFAAETTWSKSLTWPTNFNQTPNLEPGQDPFIVPLAPGAYHTVDVKSRRMLLLSAGEYFLDNLTVQPGGILSIDGSAGPVFVYILEGGFTFRGEIREFATTPPLGFASFTIMTTGSATIEQPFRGVVIAPGGRIDLRVNTPAGFKGAFFGRDVTLFEGNEIAHYRDPFSFQGFSQGTIFGERASVTGGSIQLPGPFSTPTDESFQAEAVTAISRSGSSSVVTVGYNDLTTALINPSITYTDFTVTGDPRDGTVRLVKKGTTLMGWSYSTDGGRTFNYGGRVAPPTGTSIIWGDSSIAKLNVDDANVYYAQLSGSEQKFELVWNSQLQAIVSDSTASRVAGALDGYCISRSTDRGVTFPSIKCIKDVFQDGSSLAVAMDQAGHRQVYVAGTGGRVWRMDGETMTFANSAISPGPLVFTPAQGQLATGHPRMAVFNGMLYYVQFTEGNLGVNYSANRLNAATNSTTWLGQTVVASNPNASGLGKAATFPLFSFDFGPGSDGTNKFRLIYSGGAKPGTPGIGGLRVVECNLDLTGCQQLGWSTLAEPGNEGGFNIRFGAGQWVAAWRKQEVVGSATVIRSVAARLLLANGVATLDQRTLFQGQVPCAYGTVADQRWGEYNHIDSFGDGRFFAPYTVNGPGCRWRGLYTADAHVGGSVFKF